MNAQMGSGVLYIVEDDDQVRVLLERVAASIGLQACSFSRADDLLRLETFASSGVVLMDLQLPGMSGLEAFRRLSARNCGLPVVFLTGFADVPTVAQAMKAGAFDFLEKPFQQKQLVEVVQAALARHAVQSERDARRQHARQRLDQLTPRERDVVPYLLCGWPSKRIALRLHISKKAIDLHRSNILKRSRAGSVPELVRLVVDAGDEALLARAAEIDPNPS